MRPCKDCRWCFTVDNYPLDGTTDLCRWPHPMINNMPVECRKRRVPGGGCGDLAKDFEPKKKWWRFWS